MAILIGKVLSALECVHLNLKSIVGMKIIRNSNGAINHAIGNNAVVVQCCIDGNKYAMRCYLRDKPHLQKLYGERYYPQELNIGGVRTTKYIDVVLCDWIEGSSLSKAVALALATEDKARLERLAEEFDKLALWLIGEDWAHGDLSPENIIVGEDETLHLIDMDARYTPQLEGFTSCELGTQAYQSRHRKSEDFGARIDDYSIAIISASLHALAIDPTLKSRFPFMDGLLLDGYGVSGGDYRVLDHILELFATNGAFRAYNIAKSLKLNLLKIDILPELLRKVELLDRNLELFINWGACGYCDSDSGEVIIPPLYDEAFEFRGDYALVRLSAWWYYIDKTGEAVESCGEWSGMKPPKIRAQS